MTVTDISREPGPAKAVRLAAYCRVSSTSADQLHSFAAQIRYYKDYERKNPRYRLVDVYADEGLTGTGMKKRDELNRLLRDCRLGRVDRIITKSVSRFARNTQELLVTLRGLKEMGVSVYFEEQGIDSGKLNMEMLVTFPGLAAQQESVSISENQRWSYQKRMESGEFNCCAPAYGYELVDGQLVVKEDEAAVIRRIFDLCLQGLGKQNIANLLNAENVPRRYGQKKWRHNTISYVINNERYMGDALLQKAFTTDTLPFRKKKNRGEKPQYYVENSNPPIVSRETYQAAQELQKARSVSHPREGGYLLAGLLRCPDCGSRMIRRNNKRAAKCSQRWICQNSGCRTVIHKADDVLLDDIMILLDRLIVDPESIIIPMESACEPSMAVRKMENEIGRTLDTLDYDKASLRQKMLECASLKYAGIDPAPYTALRLKAAFANAEPLSAFSLPLFKRTVKEIRLDESGTVSIKLMNDQVVGKDDDNAADYRNAEENSAEDTRQGRCR